MNGGVVIIARGRNLIHDQIWDENMDTGIF